ncbi:MAG: ATP-binding protein [Geminicoccaceae bacterium]
MPAVFEGEDYQEQRGAIEREFKANQDQTFKAVADRARAEGLVLGRTQEGFTIVPLKPDGEILEPEQFQQMPEEERDAIQKKISAIQEELEAAMKSIPQLDKERREKVRRLNRRLAEIAVARAMEELDRKFADVEPVKAHLAEIARHLAEHSHLFVQAAQHDGEPKAPEQSLPLDLAFNRFKANVVVCHDCGEGAPVVFLDFPGLGHLLGRIEHVPHMGAMLTDFTLIKPGAMHRANGGYLIIDAERLLQMPGSWQALKRCLRSRSVAIESPATGMSTTTAVTLEPEPVPLDVKIVLIGERQTFYMLQAADNDFAELFKVAADFDELIEWNNDTVRTFCRLLGGIARRETERALTAAACAAVIERAARLSDDRERLTLRVGALADIVREADYWAGREGVADIDARHIEMAIAEQIRRTDRIRERMHEQILRDSVLIDVDGARTGQINGLSVMQVGHFAFGKPTRITARARMGRGEILDIEREVEMGGPLHSKGVLILSGFMASRFVPDLPVSMSATLVFEQSYGGVDGDSASSTELYALLSALSGVPIRQGLAVTGSVNQAGDVQAIGGVNEKIEGFFDICAARGLTGDQGVLVPQSNVKNLMLRTDIVDACRAGRFSVHSVAHVDEGIELLTGTAAGVRGEDGLFPRGTINRMVEDRLIEFALARQRFTGPHGPAV